MHIAHRVFTSFHLAASSGLSFTLARIFSVPIRLKTLSYQAEFFFAKAFFSPLQGVGLWPGLGKSFFFPSEAVVWFHITSRWHMLCFKPITVFIHVWSDWPMPLWRGWPHASLSPILCTIWQSGVFFSHSFSFCLSLSSLTGFYSISSSHLLVSISISILFSP